MDFSLKPVLREIASSINPYKWDHEEGTPPLTVAEFNGPDFTGVLGKEGAIGTVHLGRLWTKRIVATALLSAVAIGLLVFLGTIPNPLPSGARIGVLVGGASLALFGCTYIGMLVTINIENRDRWPNQRSFLSLNYVEDYVREYTPGPDESDETRTHKHNLVRRLANEKTQYTW